ncbi:hypothetical protein RFI_11207, partial [Reticulomyxa filosa]
MPVSTPVVCHECGRTFKNGAALGGHKRVHNPNHKDLKPPTGGKSRLSSFEDSDDNNEERRAARRRRAQRAKEERRRLGLRAVARPSKPALERRRGGSRSEEEQGEKAFGRREGKLAKAPKGARNANDPKQWFFDSIVATEREGMDPDESPSHHQQYHHQHHQHHQHHPPPPHHRQQQQQQQHHHHSLQSRHQMTLMDDDERGGDDADEGGGVGGGVDYEAEEDGEIAEENDEDYDNDEDVVVGRPSFSKTGKIMTRGGGGGDSHMFTSRNKASSFSTTGTATTALSSTSIATNTASSTTTATATATATAAAAAAVATSDHNTMTAHENVNPFPNKKVVYKESDIVFPCKTSAQLRKQVQMLIKLYQVNLQQISKCYAHDIPVRFLKEWIYPNDPRHDGVSVGANSGSGSSGGGSSNSSNSSSSSSSSTTTTTNSSGGGGGNNVIMIDSNAKRPVGCMSNSMLRSFQIHGRYDHCHNKQYLWDLGLGTCSDKKL